LKDLTHADSPALAAGHYQHEAERGDEIQARCGHIREEIGSSRLGLERHIQRRMHLAGNAGGSQVASACPKGVDCQPGR